MERVVILGGGMSGLVAAYAFNQHKCLVRVVEGGKPGGGFASGGLKYLHRSEPMANMLHTLGVVFTNYSVQGGIHLHGAVEPYPAVFKTLGKERSARIQADHYKKTRRTEPDEFASRSMNDPESSKSRHSLQCDIGKLVSKLVSAASIVPKAARWIDPARCVLAFSDGTEVGWDRLVVTIPLWVVKRISPVPVPDVAAMKLNLIDVEPRRDPYAKWDYVYTPYTPEDLIHRISPREGGYSCEFNGSWADGDGTSERLASDLNFLFPDGWALHGVHKGLNGHLLPLGSPMVWPEGMYPLGRFSQWDSRATTDTTLDAAFQMAKEWGLATR